MSKQSNQRYRKETEKENMKKQGRESNSSKQDRDNLNRDKLNTEYYTSSDNSNSR